MKQLYYQQSKQYKICRYENKTKLMKLNPTPNKENIINENVQNRLSLINQNNRKWHVLVNNLCAIPIDVDITNKVSNAQSFVNVLITRILIKTSNKYWCDDVLTDYWSMSGPIKLSEQITETMINEIEKMDREIQKDKNRKQPVVRII